MENQNYLIILAISSGENFPVFDDIIISKENKPYVVLEARFNEELLISDSIPIYDSNPKLHTELAYQLDRKSLHLFRIERKPIKLQCFIESLNNGLIERQFIGYTVFDIRNAQNTQNPKFQFKTLLNPKYKGASHKRPQICVALTLSKCNENEQNDEKLLENEQNYLKENQTENGFNSIDSDQYFQSDIKVMLKNGFYHIWDEKSCSLNNCNLKFNASFTIVFAANLYKLFDSLQEIENRKPFHFRYSFLGTTIKTEPFSDINSCNFTIERTTFKIVTTSRSTLCNYFELCPTIELQFCDNFGKLFGFATITLSQFADKNEQSFKPIEGSFMLLPNDESLDIDEPFPVIGISIELKRENDNKNDKRIESELSPISEPVPKKTIEQSLLIQNNSIDLGTNQTNEYNMRHFCFAIDLRSICITDSTLPSIDSCYLQFSYAFFGFTDSIKTFPSIKLSFNSDITIPHGFCAFNFATTEQQLHKTFKNIPLIIEVIEKSTINTLIGTSNINLFELLKLDSNEINAKQIANTTIPVINEEDLEIAKLQVIICLQDLGIAKIPNITNSPEVTVLKSSANDSISGNAIKNIDDLLIEAALEIEIWKEKQLIMFREEMKQNESEYMNKTEQKNIQKENELKNKLNELTLLETKLKQSFEDLENREINIALKENEIYEKQREVNLRYQKLNDEIAEAMNEIKEHYEQRIIAERDKFKEIEFDKSKYQEKVYSLERKIKEKDNKIKELEELVSKYESKNKSPLKKTITTTASRSLIRDNKVIKTQTNGTSTSPKKIFNSPNSQINGNAIQTQNNVRTRSQSVVSTRPRFINSVNSESKPKLPNTPIKTTRSNSVVRNEKSKNEEKLKLVEKLKSDRNELIKSGISTNDPIISEIDKCLQKIRLT